MKIWQRMKQLWKRDLKTKMGYPVIQRIAVENDSKIDLDQPASQFQFIGQDGKILASRQSGSSASYHINPEIPVACADFF
jgi:hypothetical protein